MKTVFIGGSRRLSRINDVIRSRMEALVDGDFDIIVGDANGADKSVQKFLAERDYPRVTVFHSGTHCRNNVGRWATKSVAVESAKKDFAFYATKDRAMAEVAEYGFMLWDGESKGTLNNIFNLIERGKKVVVYFSPQERCITVARSDDLRQFLSDCSDEARSVFESRAERSEPGGVAEHQPVLI